VSEVPFDRAVAVSNLRRILACDPETAERLLTTFEGTGEDTSVSDLVNHPPHYTAHPSGVECITVVEHMGFNLGNAVKYIWRAGEKGDAIEDLRKAAWYVNREIERMSQIPKVADEAARLADYATHGLQGGRDEHQP